MRSDTAVLHCPSFSQHRKRALLLSLSGVVFGVAFFICSASPDTRVRGILHRFNTREQWRARCPLTLRTASNRLDGSAQDFEGTMSRHRQYFEGITNANEIMRISRQFSNVVACSPILRGTLSARSGFENATVDLYGIEPALHLQTTDLAHQLSMAIWMISETTPNSVHRWIPSGRSVERGVGDTVQLLSPGGQYRRFDVAALARSGVGPIDSTRIYCHARLAQILLRKPYAALHDHLQTATTWTVLRH